MLNFIHSVRELLVHPNTADWCEKYYTFEMDLFIAYFVRKSTWEWNINMYIDILVCVVYACYK